MHLPKPYVEPLASEVSIGSGPFARRDGEVIELTRYQQLGTVKIDGDTVTQQIGRGKTAEYSLAQLASHSKDPEMFAATMQYAADHGDSVKIDVHHGVSRVTDANLESRLPQDFPFRDVVMRAAVTHDLDPRILGAVGMQESGMGKGENYDPITKLGADGHGHGMWQLDDRFPTEHPMADCIRAGNDPVFAANTAADMLSKQIAKDGRDLGIQRYNGDYPDLPYTRLIDGQMARIEHQVQQQQQGLSR
jgi:hypothetical protein